MAIGDDALADGMDVVAGTADRRVGYQEINKTRDYIAQRITTVRTWVTNTINALWPLSIARGGTGKASAGDALAALGAWGNSGAVAAGYYPRLGWNGARLVAEIPGFALPFEIARVSDIPSGGGSAYEGVLNPAIYGRAPGGSWKTLAIQSDGVLTPTSSARRFKDHIEALDISDEEIAKLRLVEFDWKADGTHDVGLIADDVAKVLPWAVFHDENGLVLGVHYERVALAMLPAMQRLLVEVDLIAQRLADVER